MQSENRLFDDVARFLNGVAGTVAGMTREGEAAMRERAREFLGGMDFVSRDEFEAVKTMAAHAREEADRLARRVAALESARADGAGSKGEDRAAPAGAFPSAMEDERAADEPHVAAPKKDHPGRKPADG